MALSDNLVAFWELEESGGTRVDAVGSNDLSTGGATIGNAAGVVGWALDLEADFGNYLSIADTADLSMGDIDFTIAFWAYLETKPGFATLVGKDDFGVPTREYFVIYNPSADRLQFYVSPDGSGFSVVTADALGSPSTATWYFVVAWHDATANTINIQVNDGTVNSAAHSTGVFNGTAPFALGVGFNNGAAINSLDGRLDQVGIWKRVLTSGERTALYNSGAGLSYAAIAGAGGGAGAFNALLISP